MKIRKMCPGDLDRVLANEFTAYDFPWTRGVFSDCMNTGNQCWVLESEGMVIGHAVVSVGAGEAQYFEWAEVHVVFERPPSEDEQAAIAETVPPPLTDSIDFDGVYLMVASDQFAHMAMAEAYGRA